MYFKIVYVALYVAFFDNVEIESNLKGFSVRNLKYMKSI